MNEQAHLQQVLGYTFKQPELLQKALTHSSMVKQHQSRIDSNERLEFLGDRVLGLIVAEWLYHRFPTEAEGDLARRFAALVRRESLASVAESISLEQHLRIGTAVEVLDDKESLGIIADACEALIGALYLDGGLPEAERFIKTQWADMLEAELTPPQDAKTTLQEWVQARNLALPVYREINREGPDHNPVFTIEVSVDGYPAHCSRGPSKRMAEQTAAQQLLDEVLLHND